MRPKSSHQHGDKAGQPHAREERQQHQPQSTQVEQKSEEPEEQEVLLDPLPTNPDGRNYTVEEMLEIWDVMKRTNSFVSPPIDPDNELFQSIQASAPAAAALDEASRVPRVYVPRNVNRLSTGAPVAIPLAASLIPAEQIAWVYLDSSGNEQGPFSGVRMQEWYEGEWLQDELQIRRMGESEFYALREFVNGVGNSLEPFLVPRPAATAPRPAGGARLMVGPEHMNWIYKDPSGAEQGPFDGLRMQEWFSMDWLKDDLLIRRLEEVQYYPLRAYKALVGNDIEPFLVPQPVVVSLGGYFEDAQARINLELELRQRELEQVQLAVLKQQQELEMEQGLVSERDVHPHHPQHYVGAKKKRAEAVSVLAKASKGGETPVSGSSSGKRQPGSVPSLKEIQEHEHEHEHEAVEQAEHAKTGDRAESISCSGTSTQEELIKWCIETMGSMSYITQQDLLTRLFAVSVSDVRKEKQSKEMIVEVLGSLTTPLAVDQGQFADELMRRRRQIERRHEHDHDYNRNQWEDVINQVVERLRADASTCGLGSQRGLKSGGMGDTSSSSNAGGGPGNNERSSKSFGNAENAEKDEDGEEEGPFIPVVHKHHKRKGKPAHH